MKAFRVGFILTLSFLLVMAVFSGTIGFYPPPKGLERPEYPTPSTDIIDYNDPAAYERQQAEQRQKYDEYQVQVDAYEKQQKTFTQEKIVPYAQTVFAGWIIAVVLFTIIGLIMVQLGSTLVGGGFAFSGFWAVVLGPVGGFMWYAGTIVSRFANTANESYSADPLMQTICITSTVGIVVLSAVGFILESKNRPQFI